MAVNQSRRLGSLEFALKAIKRQVQTAIDMNTGYEHEEETEWILPALYAIEKDTEYVLNGLRVVRGR